ncbi:MAG: hypothetical protein GY898_21235 [Proteobacteria bacterium]|nr:hypothetical protein [Pseudomonadota bacterium]
MRSTPSFLFLLVVLFAASGCYGPWGEPPADKVAADPVDEVATEGGGSGAYGHGAPCDSDEVLDCAGNCAPANWVDDGYCDDGSYQYDGHAIFLDCPAYDWDGGDCPVGDDPGDDDDEEPAEPPWADDCGENSNDLLPQATPIAAVDGQTYDAQICAGDIDVFSLNVPAGAWASVEIDIDGSGSGSSDLDLYELAGDGQASFQNSYTTYGYERVAVRNPTSTDRLHWFQVRGYEGATASYELVVQTSPFHDGRECDGFYEDSPAEGGPCNEILQFPRSNGTFEGSYPEHKAAWSSVRREVAYVIRWAADEVADEFPGTTPLGLLDMSEKDGSTPGTGSGDLRHPSGTHVNGNDMDVAYYQTDGANNGDIVCPSHNGQFCTGEASILDAERTAYFLAQLLLHPEVRVIGVDPVVAEDVLEAADGLYAADRISSYQRNRMDSKLAYGNGWPFHHHHLHFSWNWEGGWSVDGEAIPNGCLESASVVEAFRSKAPALPLVEAFPG